MRLLRFLAPGLCVLLACHAIGQRKPSSGVDLPYVSGKRWAIVVGASKYTHFSPLEFADDDAISFAKALKTDFSFDPANVRLLTDGDAQAQQPTAGNILGEVEDILSSRTLDKSDLFIFFFSGHGVGTDKGDFLLPTDARTSSVERVGLPISEVISRFTNAGLANVLIIVDACRSGKTNPFGSELQELGRKANLAVMLGCAPGARSYEEKPLGHGLFAYSLLNALKDPSLRDPRSGSLWASKVAASVRSRVFDYSERDHPDEPQTPSVWTNATADVLLGAYMPEGNEALEAFKGEAERLAPDAHAAALAGFADNLMTASRYDDAIEILKTLEGLGRLTPSSQYLLGAALLLSDRNSESSEVLSRLIQSNAPVYFRNLAIATSTALNKDPKQKVAAAKGLWDEDKSDDIAGIVWAVLRAYGSKADQTAFLQSASATVVSKRLKLALAGDQAWLQGKYKEAADNFVAALGEEGSTPHAHPLSIAAYNALTMVGDPKAVDDFVAQRIARGDEKAYWLATKAQRLKDGRKAEECLPVLRDALKCSPNAEQLLSIASIAGKFKDQLKTEILGEAQKHKFSWRAKLAEAYALYPADPKLSDTLDEAERLADDPVVFLATSIGLFESLLREYYEAKIFPQADYIQYLETVFGAMLAGAEMFGESEAAWWEFALVAANVERDYQVAGLAKRILASPIAAGTLSAACSLPVLIALANSGDMKTAELIHKAAVANGLEGGDISRIWCIALAGAGRMDEARSLAKKLTPYPSAEADVALSALKAWLLADAKDAAGARKILDVLKPIEPYAKQMAGLAYAALGEWETAAPLLATSLEERSWGYLPVSASAMKQYDAYLRRKKDREKLAQVAYNAGLSRPGNPFFAEFSFLDKPDTKAFNGEIELAIVSVSDLADPYEGTLKLRVQDGEVSGTMDSKNEVAVITGTVDGFGNIKGAVRIGNKSLDLVAKIAPPDLYGKFPGFNEKGQVFLMYDENFRRTAWVGKPKTK